MYTGCRCDSCGPAVTAQLGSWGGDFFDPNAPGAPQTESAWYNRAIDWARALFGSRVPDCRDPFTDPEVLNPCPGELSSSQVRRIWSNAPLPARAEMWARTVGNNPQWRCANPGTLLSDPRTATVVMRAAMGGRDCHMSNDRSGLANAWRVFVQQWKDGGTNLPEWIDDNVLNPIGRGAVEGLLPVAAAGLLLLVVTRS